MLACGPATAQTVLRVKPFSDLRSLDPIVITDYAVRNQGYTVYDTLVPMDDKQQIKPQMAKRW